MYHFVWIPKYRHKIFIEPYRESLKLIIKKIGYDYNIEIVELESSREPLYRDSLSHHRTSDVAYGGFAVMFTKS